MILTETGNSTGIFRYDTGINVSSGTAVVNDGVLQVGALGDTITTTYTDGTKTASTVSLMNNFSVTVSSPQTAGIPFALIITARKSDGSTITGYSGTVTLTTNYVSPTSGSYAVSPTSTASFTSGVATVNVTYADAGTITITATDTSSKTGTSSQILVLPANFLVESTGGLSQVVGKPFNLKVTARNASNSTCPNYKRDVNLTLSNVTPTGTTATISPATISGSSFSSGAKTVSLTYNKWGTAKITATDAGYSSITGTNTSAINFYPNSFSITPDSPPASRSKFYLKEPFDITVKVLDYDGNAITNYGGTITFTAVSKVETPEDYIFSSDTDNGEKAFTLSGSEEKTFVLEVKDKTYTSATGKSSDIGLMYGKIRVKDASGRIGTINTTVEIVDKNDKVITDDDSTTFTLTSKESIDNSSSQISSPVLTVTEGTATIAVTDTELETVTVTPSSEPSLDPEPGVITFGETAVGGGGAKRLGSGARVLFWRELRTDEKP